MILGSSFSTGDALPDGKSRFLTKYQILRKSQIEAADGTGVLAIAPPGGPADVTNIVSRA
jgi:hypothetical protein